MLNIEPRKSVYQIYLSRKSTDEVLLDVPVIAYSEPEAIEKAKVGSVIENLGLTRDDVDFYIRIVGVLYEGKTFADAIAKTPPITTSDLPHSTISAVVKSIASDKLSCIVTRTYQGVEYDIKTTLTKLTAEKLGKQPGINAGDTVLVTYVDHAPIGTLPIIVDSIAAIVYP